MPGGRPTDYKEEYCIDVEKLCKLGATDKEIATFFEVDERTINNWKQDHPEFFQSIKRGKIIADANVAESLYKKATGFQNGLDYYPPDTAAINIWLKNRRGKVDEGAQRWGDKTEADVRHSGYIANEYVYENDSANEPISKETGSN